MSRPSGAASLENLGRLIANEESTSNLLALLIELDGAPLAESFDLPDDRRYHARREVSTHGRTGKKGRLDLVIFDAETDAPVVVIEMKGAADIHGDQLERYLAWAQRHDPQPALFLCAFDHAESSSDPAWTRRRLRDVFSAWRSSNHVHAAWLAAEIVRLLDDWDREAEDLLGRRTGHYVPDIVTKRLLRGVSNTLEETFGSLTYVLQENDKGGHPMLVAWAAHPRDPEDLSVAVGVDVRSSGRRTASTIWKVRPHVEVDVLDDRDLGAARRLAFDLAMRIHRAMGRENIVRELAARGHHKVSQAFLPKPNDGFARSIAGFDPVHWAQRIAEESTYPRGGIFRHDKGTRLASILDLDVAALTRHDVEDLIVAVLEILYSAAQDALHHS